MCAIPGPICRPQNNWAKHRWGLDIAGIRGPALPPAMRDGRIIRRAVSQDESVRSQTPRSASNTPQGLWCRAFPGVSVNNYDAALLAHVAPKYAPGAQQAAHQPWIPGLLYSGESWCDKMEDTGLIAVASLDNAYTYRDLPDSFFGQSVHLCTRPP